MESSAELSATIKGMLGMSSNESEENYVEKEPLAEKVDDA
jgi:hypothetical protein